MTNYWTFSLRREGLYYAVLPYGRGFAKGFHLRIFFPVPFRILAPNLEVL